MAKKLNITVKRTWNKPDKHYCVGEVFLNGKKFCNSMEPADYGLEKSMSVDVIKRFKETHMEAPVAIPTGSYRVVLDVVSPKYTKSEYYQRICKARVPRLIGVPGYEGVLIHVGNIAGVYGQTDTLGCLLVGENTKQGMVCNSKVWFEKLYKILKQYDDIFITYTR